MPHSFRMPPWRPALQAIFLGDTMGTTFTILIGRDWASHQRIFRAAPLGAPPALSSRALLCYKRD
jgi:hypothetical protein